MVGRDRRARQMLLNLEPAATQLTAKPDPQSQKQNLRSVALAASTAPGSTVKLERS